MASTDSELIRKAEAILASAKSFKGDRTQRYELMRQVELLHKELEAPMDVMFNLWSHMNTATALAVMVQSTAFEKMPREGSISATDLGAAVNIDPDVIARFMRMLTGTGIVSLTDSDTYAHTPKSLAFLQSQGADFWNLCMNMELAHLNFPSYFTSHPPSSLTDLRATPYSYAYASEGSTFYEVLSSKPSTLNMFQKAMAQMESTIPILGMFPFREMEEEVKAEPERAFMVDVGGGRGQSLVAVRGETGGVWGTGSRCVLQDLEHILDTVPQDAVEGIEKMGYDFYTEQPVKNAHIYFLRRIMHNYQDGICQSILRNIAAAMGPTSRLLIAEIVVPAQTRVGEDMSTYWMDLVMLAIGGKERREKDFRELLEPVGLEVVRIWKAEVDNQAVVECRLKK